MRIKQYFNAYGEGQTSSGLDFTYCPKCSTELMKKEIDGSIRNFCSNCHFIQYINPLPGVAVLIEKDSKLLIGKRCEKSIESGKWCLPCGFVEHHENYLDAAHREVLEETGLEIKITSLVNVSSNRITPDLHSIVAVLTAEVVKGIPAPGDDMVELRWLSRNDAFPEMAFEGDEFTIKKYFENKLARIPIDPRFRLVNRIE
jgi:ADP-ribose pyrophosphatase YjhB (NUDIX family)